MISPTNIYGLLYIGYDENLKNIAYDEDKELED